MAFSSAYASNINLFAHNHFRHRRRRLIRHDLTETIRRSRPPSVSLAIVLRPREFPILTRAASGDGGPAEANPGLPATSKTVERAFDYKDIPQDCIVKLAAIKLKKNASLWLENLKRVRQCEERNKITTWSKMKKEMQYKYLPAYYRQDVFLKLHHLHQ